jgi:predicted transcriptional regulator
MPETNQVKDEARKLVDALPDDVTWDEFARRVYERRAVEQGRADIAAGRFVTTDELLEKFGLKR